MTGIQLRNVTFGYRKKDKLLDNINLNIESGSFIGITGINGSGKTTFAFLLNGLAGQSVFIDWVIVFFAKYLAVFTFRTVMN